MINEYFIQPELIYKWSKSRRDTRFFLSSFGVGFPRLLSTFPKSKATKLRGLLLSNIPDDLSDLQKKVVEEFAAELSQNSIKRSINEILPEDWREAVSKVCLQSPPDVILATNKIEGIDCSIDEDGAYDRDSLFNHKRQIAPQRTIEGLSGAVKNLLRYSSEIVIADPYTFKDRGLESAARFMNTAMENRINNSDVKIKVLFDAEKGNSVYMREKLEPTASALGIGLTIIAIKEKENGEKFHNRYILTEYGGVSFGTGTDSSASYHTDDLVLMEEHIYSMRWSQYRNAEAFEIV